MLGYVATFFIEIFQFVSIVEGGDANDINYLSFVCNWLLDYVDSHQQKCYRNMTHDTLTDAHCNLDLVSNQTINFWVAFSLSFTYCVQPFCFSSIFIMKSLSLAAFHSMVFVILQFIHGISVVFYTALRSLAL